MVAEALFDGDPQYREEPPTAFELMTAVAFLHFAECACDVVVLEVGLGVPLGEQDLSPNIPRTEERGSPPEELGLGVIRLPKLGKGMRPRLRG